MNKLELFIPLRSQITQIFGVNGEWYKQHGINIKGHNGIDYGCPTGTPIYATHDGIVVFCGEDSSAGLGLVLRTTEPSDYNGKPTYFKTIYWHLKSFAVKANDQVNAGD